MARRNPAAMTPAPGQPPFTLRPIIGPMLRARRCLPGSIFLVEGIDVFPVPAATPDKEDSQAMRLLLGDGRLCIQALLHPDMVYQVQRRDVFVGCCVRVGDFIMRFEGAERVGDGEEEENEGRRNEGTKSMVYLIVNQLETVGWNERYMAMWRRHKKGRGTLPAIPEVSTEEELAGEASHEAKPTPNKKSKRVVRFADVPPSPPARTPKKVKTEDKGKAKVDFTMPRPLDGHSGSGNRIDNNDDDDDDDEDVEDAFEAFDARAFPPKSVSPRKSTASTAAAATDDISTDKSQQQPVALAKDWHNHQLPLKLTTLRLIPHLPYAQNWSVNVLAIVASLSPVEPSHLPPGKQRTARIADPSTAKQVHLTVFLDPDEFTPSVGSAVLLVGVKNHRFDGGSLKKYASDGKRDNGKQWWFEDPWDLEWLDVAGIKSWWKGVEEYYRQAGDGTER